MNKITYFASIFFLMFIYSCKNNTGTSVNDRVFCFYYNWYGNPENDGNYIHWAHQVLRQGANDTITKGFIPGENDDIASNFYPQLSTYSCSDTAILNRHMEMMAESKIGVIVLTWWDVYNFGSQSVPLIMDVAATYGLKVCFHIEPFRGRNAETTRQNIQMIIDTYGQHPAFYRLNEKPLFFVYDSYLTSPGEWKTLLLPEGEITIRNTPYDVLMIGLWVKEGEEDFFSNSGFDGFYTYFGATGFTWGSTPANWPYLQEWADSNGKIFIPSVAPGYIDIRVRPWNGRTTRDRENGKYYDRMFEDAINAKVKYLGITSFNEWHEGTQIEPAIPFKSEAFPYMDYEPLTPDYYLKRTAHWINLWENSK